MEGSGIKVKQLLQKNGPNKSNDDIYTRGGDYLSDSVQKISFSDEDTLSENIKEVGRTFKKGVDQSKRRT